MPLPALRLKISSRAQAVVSRLAGRRRTYSSFDDTPVEEFLDKHLTSGEIPERGKGVTSTRREVLSLYRDVWRSTRAFTWTNEQNVPWRDVLRLSARREFEAARYERDPETITRLLFMGRSAVRTVLEKFVDKRDEMMSPGNDRQKKI